MIAIVLLGLELVTGSFALVPLPWIEREASAASVVVNWGWVFIGNLIGSVAYGALIAIVLTNMGTAAPAGSQPASLPLPKPRPSVTPPSVRLD